MQGYLYPQNVYRSICLNIVFILVGDGYELRLNVILVEANLHLINKKDANRYISPCGANSRLYISFFKLERNEFYATKLRNK